MTTLKATVNVHQESSYPLDSNYNINHRKPNKHVLKTKEHTRRSRCRKALKRKLRKYKIRYDGQEDEAVLDVSKVFLASLNITSPIKEQLGVNSSDNKVSSPKNYLFKMVRRKPIVKTASFPEPTTICASKVVATDSLIDIQDKKQTNAFKLLMDSRHKSLGSNSPGKEKVVVECELAEVTEKKKMKVKRQLLLQKMAESKGSVKKKEMEEYQEECINIKMEKRAELLKNMIMNVEQKTKKKESKKPAKTLSPRNKEESVIDVDKPVKSLQLVSMFSDTVDYKSPKRKSVFKEDEEFLKKLSPSLKKKENMLSYFKKIEKEEDVVLVENETENVVIKVKLTTKPKKRGKKKKLCLNKDIESDLSKVKDENGNKESNKTDSEINKNAKILTEENTIVIEDDKRSNDRRKRKRELKDNMTNQCSAMQLDESLATDQIRPKRSVKKPVKYSEDTCLSSSDEELHIFTPKKKKHVENTPILDDILLKSVDTSAKVVNKLKVAKKNSIEATTPKKSVKLAPIFASRMTLDPAAVEAKQKFLQSGVPDQLKKIIAKQKNKEDIEPLFSTVVHVQQLDVKNTISASSVQSYMNLAEISFEEDTFLSEQKNNFFNDLVKHSITETHKFICSKNKISVETVLRSMKQTNIKFPVYRTYRTMRARKKGEYKDCNNLDLDDSVEIFNSTIEMIAENPDKLSWTEKYKALSSKQILGNYESIRELRKWLVSWTENQKKSKPKSFESDLSDFYQSDTDSRDNVANNLLILTGPVGCGKTSNVYSVATELAIKVIEVNASSRRTGKIMLQDLQEATQSHKVNRGTGSENSQKTQPVILEVVEVPVVKKKRGRPKKADSSIEKPVKKDPPKTDKRVEKPVKRVDSMKIEASGSASQSSTQESTRTVMSLILIDDADIVFDQDDGFCSAVVQLVQSSKRPVILVTSSLTCPHLQRFMNGAKIIKLNSLSPRILGTWLDIICMADSGVGWPGLGAKFLDYFKGDIRKTLNCLQFYISSNGQSNQDDDISQADCFKSCADDESSNMSWADRDIDIRSEKTKDVNSVWCKFISEHSPLLNARTPLDLFNVWWSIPNLLIENYSESEDLLADESEDKKRKIKELESMCNSLDMISVSDSFAHSKRNTKAHLTSQPWCAFESHSVSEQEYMEYFDRNHEVMEEISEELVKSSIIQAQSVFHCSHKSDVYFPGMSVQRERDRVVARHNDLTSYLNPSTVLDRKALALDYWSCCRAICRIEKTKTDSNFKRNNRFCHYLKSANVLCKSDTFDNLANSLFTEKVNVTD